MFCNYDSSTLPSPAVIKLFESSIDNSFKDQLTRTRFLNKFYQCALGEGLHLKLKKLLACMWGARFGEDNVDLHTKRYTYEKVHVILGIS